jgi:hypothetical protein
MKTQYVFLFFLLFAYPLSISAQTPKENLEKAVEAYNALKEYSKPFSNKTLTQENLDVISERVEKGVAQLDKVIKEGNADQVKAARYFKINYQYQQGFMLGMKGENKKALAVFKNIDTEIIKFKQADFPIRYQYFDKNFVIKWENFGPTQAEYLTGAGEVAFNLGSLDDAVKYVRQALNHPNTTAWLRYISINKLLDIRKKQIDLVPEDEYLDLAMRAIKAYNNLTTDELKIVEDNKFPTAERGANILLDAQKNVPTDKLLTLYNEAAPLLTNLKIYNKAIGMYQFNLEKSLSKSTSFHQDALRCARELKRTDWDKLTDADKTRAKQVATNSIEFLVNGIGTDCSKYTKYAEDYLAFDEKTKADALKAKMAACLEEKKKKDERDAELKRQEEARRKKEAYRREHPFNVYIGLDLFPLFTSPDKMDFGGHLDLRGRTVGHSFGGSLVNEKKDSRSGQTRWDGYKAFYSIKFFGKKNSPGYTGLFIGYAQKSFDSIPVTITPISPNPKPLAVNTINMVDKQVEAIYNFGMQILGKGLGMDVYFGVGASYNKLSAANTDAYSRPTDFSIQSTSNDFFSKRKKETTWMPIVRVGMSLGINVGPKRL